MAAVSGSFNREKDRYADMDIRLEIALAPARNQWFKPVPCDT